MSEVWLASSQQAYNADDNVTLQIRNVLSRFDSQSLDASLLQALVQSIDDNEYTINSSTVVVTMATLAPNVAEVLSAARDELQVQLDTEIQLDLQTRTRLLSDSVLFIYLSTSAFTVAADTDDISCTLDNASTLCTYAENGNPDFHKISL